jgi:hypothetical protein
MNTENTINGAGVSSPIHDSPVAFPIRCPIFQRCNGPQWDCGEDNCSFWDVCIDAGKHPENKEVPK